MTTYLKNFVDSTQLLPSQLQTSFARLRELDAEAERLQAQGAAAVETRLLQLIQEAQQRGDDAATDGARPRDDRFDADWRRVDDLCDQKVAVAHGIYDFVDKRIQELDSQLVEFDKELAAERERLGIESGEHFADAFDAAGGNAVISGGGRGRGRGRGRATGRGAPTASAPGATVQPALVEAALPHVSPATAPGATLAPVTEEGAPAVPMPIEPTYCYCNRVSFGEMIACENEECSIEWFHLQCVGIDPANKPAGDWYCKECTEALVKQGKLKPSGADAAA